MLTSQETKKPPLEAGLTGAEGELWQWEPSFVGSHSARPFEIFSEKPKRYTATVGGRTQI